MSVVKIQGSIYSALFLQALISPLTLFGIYFLFNGVYLAAILSVLVAIYAWLDVRTSIVFLENGVVRFQHFFRVTGESSIEDSIFSHTKGGDVGLLPVVEVRNSKSGKVVGAIKKTYFSLQEINILIGAAIEQGAEVVNRRSRR